MKAAWQILAEEKYISNSSGLIEQLLLNRGLKTPEDIEHFLNPNISDFEDELNLEGIEKAKKRILEAIEKKEQIFIFGDYDVDGVCGAAILYECLTKLKAKVLPYIPHREKEGYGLSKEGLDNIKEKGAVLVITVDNGIVATNEAKYAEKIGLDLIITDHHTVGSTLPRALAIIHSLKMCGAAVAWCLTRKLLSEEDSSEFLDLVAIATVADLIPLLGLNRSLVKIGLEKLKKTKRVGLLSLISEAKINIDEITSFHIGYIIGPRINAVGRMEHALDALRLVCTRDKDRANSLAKQLCSTNDLRKQRTLEALTSAKEIYLQNLGVSQKAIVLNSKEWAAGIIGLVAGRICEEYYLPTIIISEGETQSKGSARSVDGLNIIETIRECGDLLLEVGGHEKAAGFTIETSKIDAFREEFYQIVASKTFNTTPAIKVEALVDLKLITKNWVKEINKLEPFGIGNFKPIFASKNIGITSIKTVGAGKHLKFKVVDPEQGQKVTGIDVIAFGMGEMVDILKEGQLINLAYYLEIDTFTGNEKLQLKALDIQII